MAQHWNSRKMKTAHSFGAFCKGIILSIGFLPAIWSASAEANLSGANMGTYTATPILTVESVPPLVMLAMSMDHQYFIKAYNDYTDLDKNGTVERTYSDAFEYYGYFHSDLCYKYSDTDGRFNPVGKVDSPRENANDSSFDHYCSTDTASWSGNFLNWASMTRMDVVRKILYGGLRSTDTATTSVLERSHLPGDAHSFAKYYNGADLAKLTPHDSVRTDTTNGGDNDLVDDLNEGITICNTTHAGTSGSSQTVTTGPMMRVVSGNSQLWSANERRQCTWRDEFGTNSNSNDAARSGIQANSGDPADSSQLKTPGAKRDHIVRVKVCDASQSAPQNLENCRAYGSNLKPEGLLQKYGLDGQMKFGLVTGSYADNVSGGRLRKRISAINDEVNTTNGTFITLGASTPGIIKALNAVRIWGYGYDDGTYLSGGDGGDNCNFQLTDIATEGKCASWGNPMSEIYLEALRYFASSTRGPTAAFTNGGTDNSYITGFLEDSDWSNPLNADNSCASLNTIIFNASVSSYDDNQTNPAGLTDDSAAALTKVIGDSDGEDLEGKDFFVGRSGTASNEFCTAKTVDGTNGLGDVYGLCPEAPTVRGSYHMAGLAHFAHTEDLRSDLPDQQTVKTFAVSLATAAPVIEIPVSDTRTVRILPAYRLRVGGNSATESLNDPTKDGGGALVDFKIVRPHTEVSATNNATPQAGTGVFSGLFYVNWEDSEQGGDYDQDMWGTIEYRLDTNAADKQLRITTTAVTESTGIAQLFGFITSGTTQDGFHAYSGIEGANFTDPTGVKGCNDCRPISGGGGSTGQFGAQFHDFTLSTSAAAGLLESPLYYAAKWGGFTDSDGNKKPTIEDADGDDSEWDGDGDGIPDTFYFVTDPGQLEASLREVFDTILERVSSGTAAAVVANEQKGNGALFQALYDPEKSDGDGNTARWIGTLHALFVDSHGFIREDGNSNRRIDDFETDPVIKLEFDDNADPSERRTKLIRYEPIEDDPDTSEIEGVDPLQPNPSDPAQFSEAAPVELYGEDGLRTLWNARERLSSISETNITTQRAYTSNATGGRHILTWMDEDTDNVVGSDEVIDLTAANIDAGNFFWLDTDDVAGAKALVDWVRGKDTGMTGFRKRLVDYDGADGPRDAEIMRLGDIINSTPVAVGAPFAGFDQSALDPSYAAFRAYYQERRQVVYVGANDGMIHAFNAGFFNARTLSFDLAPSETSSLTRHPLGAELWAYVPKNLLPHLQWLGRPDYSHVYFMDLPIRVFDVKIFPTNDGVHINGWGTILVAGMRFGGGNDSTGIQVDIDGDGDADNDVQTKSAYVILDITDPESPPTVLAELSPPNSQFTTSVPQVVGFGDASGDKANTWYLVFGTGPTNLADATYASHGDPLQNANVFVYDLSQMRSATRASDQNGLSRTFTLADSNVFVGDIVSTDFDIDMRDEAIYFGTVGAPVAAGDDPDDVEQGTLYRILMDEDRNSANWSAPEQLLSDLNQPFVTQPAVTIDNKLRRWVVAASGRLFVNEDKLSENQQSAYGIIDPAFSGASNPTQVSDLIDVSRAVVYSNDIIEGVTLGEGGDSNNDGAVNTNELREAVAAAGGWRKDFAINGVLPAAAADDDEETTEDSPAERSASRISLFGGIMFASLYTPSTDLCGADGSSRLLAVDFSTGVTPSFGVFPCADCDDPEVPVPESFDQGGGYSSSASVHFGEQTIEGKVTIITQDSRGELESTDAQTGSGQPAAEISWREYRSGVTGLESEAGSEAPGEEE
jgi:type IV pilus assembly protein PilY1